MLVTRYGGVQTGILLIRGGVASHKQKNAKAGVIVQISFLQGISQGKFPSNLPTSCQTKKKYFAK